MNTLDGSQHWLVQVAARAGLAGAAGLAVDRSLPIGRAWSRVADACEVTEQALAIHVARVYHLEVANLDAIEGHVLKLVPADIAREHQVFPLHQDDRYIHIAIADPTNMDTEAAIGFASGRTPMMHIAPPSALDEVITHYYSPDRAVESLLDRVDAEIESVRVLEGDARREVDDIEMEMGPVVKLTNLILSDAVVQRASDIHIAPGSKGGNVRFRIDGVLRPYMTMPLAALNRIVSRIKILGEIDIADRLRPQDGRARMAVGEHYYDLRISTVPTRDSEKAVIRILDPQRSDTLDTIDLPVEERSRFEHLLTNREGVIVVTGPTGSGKTTTLYAALKELATGDVNIMTVEDPVEYELAELTQIQVETKQGVTFGSALRAILRQDPDVILIGEIRDQETAEIAVQASLTGHLVLTTLHTNDAVGAVRRLNDLGLDKSAIVETLRGATAQRLARRVCTDCAEPIAAPRDEAEAALFNKYGFQPPVRAGGCETCGGSGYQGRLPVVELFTMTAELEEAILENAAPSRLHEAAVAGGMRPLRAVAVERVKEGITTLDEVERVLGALAAKREAATRRSRQSMRAAVLADIGAATTATTEPIATTEPTEATATPAAGSPPAPASSGPPTLAAPFAPPPRPAPAPAAAAIPSPPPTAATNGAASHILLVDDDGVNRSIARALLERDGYQVSEAEDGAVALELLFKVTAPYDLMVLDLDMPNVGGREVLKHVRHSGTTSALPVIVLTGTTDTDTEIELMEKGADDYIRKPIDPPRFTARVKAALRRAALL